MKRFLYSLFAVMICGAFPASAQEAKPAAPPVSLDALVESALRNNPEILAARAEWEAEQKDVWIESSLPDPMARVAPGSMESEYEIAQQIPFPAKLWEKGRMAGADARSVEFRYRALQKDIVNRLAGAYYRLYYVDASTAVIEEVKGLLQGIESVAQSRYSSLAGTSRDVAKAQAEVSLILERLYQLEQERETVSAAINALLNQDPMTVLGKAEAPELPELEHTLVELVNLAVMNRDEIKAAEALAEKSRHARRLAGLAYFPDVAVGLEYTRREDGETGWMIPVSFNVPLWQNRIIPEIQQANRMLEASRAEILAARNETFFQVKSAFHRYEAAKKISTLYEAAVLPQARLALNADRAGYESAEMDFLNLLDSERVYLNAKLAHIRYRTDALQAYADLMRAAGLNFSGEENENENAP